MAGALTRIGTAFKNVFGNQTELGEALKFTLLGVAAAVELIGAAIKLTLAPFRLVFEAVKGIGSAIGEALGIKQIKLIQRFSEGWSHSFLNLEKTIQKSMESAKLFGQNLVIAFQNAFIDIQNNLPDWAKRLFGIDPDAVIPTIEYKVRVTEVGSEGDSGKGESTADKTDKATKSADKLKQTWKEIKGVMADGVHGAIMGLID